MAQRDRFAITPGAPESGFLFCFPNERRVHMGICFDMMGGCQPTKGDMRNKTDDKSTWAIGGGLLTGMGVGFFFIQESPLVFVGCMLLGLGLGLLTVSIISSKEAQK